MSEQRWVKIEEEVWRNFPELCPVGRNSSGVLLYCLLKAFKLSKYKSISYLKCWFFFQVLFLPSLHPFSSVLSLFLLANVYWVPTIFSEEQKLYWVPIASPPLESTYKALWLQRLNTAGVELGKWALVVFFSWETSLRCERLKAKDCHWRLTPAPDSLYNFHLSTQNCTGD